MFLLFQLVAAEEWWQASDYPFLDSQSFRDIEAKPFLKVIKFFTPWCKYCKVIKPWFQTVAGHMQNENMKFYNMNCDGGGSQICIQMRVYSYPSIMVIHKEKQVVWRFQGLIGEDRLLSSLTQIYQQKFPKVIETQKAQKENQQAEAEQETGKRNQSIKQQPKQEEAQAKVKTEMASMAEQLRRSKQTWEQKFSNLSSAFDTVILDQKAQIIRLSQELKALKNQLAGLASNIQTLTSNHSFTNRKLETLQKSFQEKSAEPEGKPEFAEQVQVWSRWLGPASLGLSASSFLVCVYLLGRQRRKGGRV